ncbi:MAG: hypothetical protein Q8J80_10785 [Gallionella sp.]|nr:hypothetical protein [Gallionella sp.]
MRDQVVGEQAQIFVLRVVGAQVDHIARGDGGEGLARQRPCLGLALQRYQQPSDLVVSGILTVQSRQPL